MSQWDLPLNRFRFHFFFFFYYTFIYISNSVFYWIKELSIISINNSSRKIKERKKKEHFRILLSMFKQQQIKTIRDVCLNQNIILLKYNLSVHQSWSSIFCCFPSFSFSSSFPYLCISIFWCFAIILLFFNLWWE